MIGSLKILSKVSEANTEQSQKRGESKQRSGCGSVEELKSFLLADGMCRTSSLCVAMGHGCGSAFDGTFHSVCVFFPQQKPHNHPSVWLSVRGGVRHEQWKEARHWLHTTQGSACFAGTSRSQHALHGWLRQKTSSQGPLCPSTADTTHD